MTNTDDATINLARLHQALGIPSDYAAKLQASPMHRARNASQHRIGFLSPRAATHARGIPGLVAYARGRIGAGNPACSLFPPFVATNINTT